MDSDMTKHGVAEDTSPTVPVHYSHAITSGRAHSINERANAARRQLSSPLAISAVAIAYCCARESVTGSLVYQRKYPIEPVAHDQVHRAR